MTEKKRAFKWWWPWQIDQIEAYFERMAKQGWMLAHADWTCTSFLFEKQEPASVRFCLDYQAKETQEYITLLHDDGWKMEFRGSGWYVWSKAYQGARPDIYTDRESLYRRNSGILASLSALLAAQIPIGVVIMDDLAGKSAFAIALLILWGILIAAMAGATIGMALGLNSLKRKKVSVSDWDGGSLE